MIRNRRRHPHQRIEHFENKPTVHTREKPSELVRRLAAQTASVSRSGHNNHPLDQPHCPQETGLSRLSRLQAAQPKCTTILRSRPQHSRHSAVGPATNPTEVSELRLDTTFEIRDPSPKAPRQPSPSHATQRQRGRHPPRARVCRDVSEWESRHLLVVSSEVCSHETHRCVVNIHPAHSSSFSYRDRDRSTIDSAWAWPLAQKAAMI